jgi:hypothetical protein
MVKAVIHQSRVPDPLGVLAFFISTTILEVDHQQPCASQR